MAGETGGSLGDCCPASLASWVSPRLREKLGQISKVDGTQCYPLAHIHTHTQHTDTHTHHNWKTQQQKVLNHTWPPLRKVERLSRWQSKIDNLPSRTHNLSGWFKTHWRPGNIWVCSPFPGSRTTWSFFHSVSRKIFIFPLM